MGQGPKPFADLCRSPLRFADERRERGEVEGVMEGMWGVRVGQGPKPFAVIRRSIQASFFPQRFSVFSLIRRRWSFILQGGGAEAEVGARAGSNESGSGSGSGSESRKQ